MSARGSVQRAEDMIKRRDGGDTLDAIAQVYGVSRQRVLQIIQQREAERKVASRVKR